MKKFLAILVLGLLWCNVGFAEDIANCNLTADRDIDGNKYTCTTDDTFDNTGAEYNFTYNNTIITTAGNSPTGVEIKNSWTIEQDGNAKPAINGASSVGLKITNNFGGTIKSDTKAINMSSGTGAVITNAGDITSDGDYGIKSTGTDLTVNNTGTILANKRALEFSAAATGAKITNSGSILGTTSRTIIILGDNATITNESGGLIRAGATTGSTVDTALQTVLFSSTASDFNGTLENYGTITGARNTVKIGAKNITVNNYSGGTISATDTDGQTAAVMVDKNNTTITNKGTISGTAGSTSGQETHSIEVSTGITGTKIYVDGAPTFTQAVELTDSTVAANTTMYLGCSMTQDTTIEIHNHGGALNIENNLCGNDTYTLSTEVLDGSDSDDGYLIVDEGLEVVSNNASYRSENVLTKLKGLFSAANYIDGVEPEDKFFRLFYSNVKRENMYKGSMAGVVGQLSPINWGNVTSNVFLGYSKHHGDFDNGEFLGGGNYALGLKNVFTKNGLKVSFSPMIGLNDLDVTDYDSDSTTKVKTNLLSEFLAVNGKIDKEIKTSETGSLNLSVQSTLGLQRFPDYLSKFSDGDLSVDEAIEQVLSGGFEVKYNEELGKGFVIRPYVGVSLNHNLNNNIDIVKDNDSKPASPADSVTSGYYAGLTLNKKAKDISFDLDLMYGNEDGLINQIAAVSFTKTFGQVKTAKLEKKSDTLKVDKSSTTQDYDKDLTELGKLRKTNEALKAQNEALKTQNEKLKLLAQKTLEENQASKKLIIELLKENEKIKLEKQMMTNQILESENKELLEQLMGSNEENKPPVKFLIIFATIFMLATIGLTSIVASIYNRIMYRPARA